MTAPDSKLAAFSHSSATECTRGQSFAGWHDSLSQLRSGLQQHRQSPWGFGQLAEGAGEPSKPKAETLKYDPGDRLHIWQVANHLGYRHILDTSATGTGKSFDAGRLTPEMFDARQVIYISKEHRNPTAPTLDDWHDLEARHQGLERDRFGKLRRVEPDQPSVVPPNCGRSGTIAALRAKNIAGADTAELVCATCPYIEPCRAGTVFGFLHHRAVALRQPRLRVHPDSLPSPGEYDYNHVVLVWEEASDILKAHRSIAVRTADVERIIVTLVAQLPTAFDALRPLVTALHRYLSGEIKQPNKYGWDDPLVRQLLPGVEDIDPEAIRKALAPDPKHLLDWNQKFTTSTTPALPPERNQETTADQSTVARIASELALDWLPDFLDVLLGKQIGCLRICSGVLTVTLGERRLPNIANRAGCNIYLDATATVAEITRPLQLADAKQLLVAEQITPTVNNLEVIQVTTLGRLGLTQRSDYCSQRLAAVIDQIQQQAPGEVVALDFKRHTKDGDGKRHWWVDSRGINDLANCQTLILTGTPCPNLSELVAEFTVLYNRCPRPGKERVRYPIRASAQTNAELQPYLEMEVSADLEFRQFVRCRILATYHQAIGRLRAHRRPQEKLTVYIIADYPLDIPVIHLPAAEITPKAAGKKEQKLMAMLAAAQQLQAVGQKVTQQAVATVVGCSQQYVSRLWDLLQSLLNNSYSKSSKQRGKPNKHRFSQFLLPYELLDINWALRVLSLLELDDCPKPDPLTDSG